MDEAELKDIEKLNQGEKPTALWEQLQIYRLISEVRRLKAENERLNSDLFKKSQSANEAWESRERLLHVATAPLTPQFEQISRTEFIAGYIAGHNTK